MISLQVIAIVWSSMIKDYSSRLVGWRSFVHVNVGKSINRLSDEMRSCSNTCLIWSPSWISTSSTWRIFFRWIVFKCIFTYVAVWIVYTYISNQMLTICLRVSINIMSCFWWFIFRLIEISKNCLSKYRIVILYVFKS